VTTVVDICLVPLETGGCGFFSFISAKSFYFNSETRLCAEVSSGCSASDNAFDSMEACEQQCAHHFATSSVTEAAAAVTGKYSALFIKMTYRCARRIYINISSYIVPPAYID